MTMKMILSLISICLTRLFTDLPEREPRSCRSFGQRSIYHQLDQAFQYLHG